MGGGEVRPFRLIDVEADPSTPIEFEEGKQFVGLIDGIT